MKEKHNRIFRLSYICVIFGHKWKDYYGCEQICVRCKMYRQWFGYAKTNAYFISVHNKTQN